MSNRVCIIGRGMPGSGKSHLLRHLNVVETDIEICSADNFFVNRVEDSTGNSISFYKFEPEKLPQAHNDCMAQFIDALHAKKQCVVVDNTNTHFWEFENYIRLALDAGYQVISVNVNPETKEELRMCIERQQHDVPLAIVLKIWYEMEPVSTWPHWAKSEVKEKHYFNLNRSLTISELLK